FNFKDQRLTFTLTFVQFWTIFICILMGTGLISSDLNNNIVSAFLVLPIKRSTYLLSRIFGGSLILGLFLLLSISIVFIFNWAQLSTWEYFSKALLCFLILFFVSFTSLVIAVFTNFFTSEKLGIFFTSIIFFLIYCSNLYVSIKTSEQILKEGLGLLSSLALVSHSIFPRLGNMVWMGNSLFSPESQSMGDMGYQIGHFVITSSFWVWCAIKTFNRKDI
ncbi:MAG: hypothetical protein ACO2ZP_11870, partial [Bacteriovoracaceae bacterium]